MIHARKDLIDDILKLEKEMTINTSPMKFDKLFTEQWTKRLQIKQLLEQR